MIEKRALQRVHVTAWVFLAIAPSATTARGAPPPSPFVVTVVDSIGQSGYGSSLVLAPGEEPRIAYLENWTRELRFAKRGPTGWQVETLGSAGHSRVALRLASDGRMFLAYPGLLAAGGGLRLATFSGSQWTFETLDAEYFAGAWPDLELDGDDQPHLVYSGNSCTGLAYGWKDASGFHKTYPGGSCLTAPYPSMALDGQGFARISHEWNSGVFYRERSSAGWSATLLVPNNASGTWTTIALDAQGEPHVAFLDPVSRRLRYGRRQDGAWSLVTVDSGFIASHPSIAVDGAGRPHIAYYYPPLGDLRYAVLEENGWSITVVDSAGDVGQDASMVLSDDGRAHIAYQDVGRLRLRYAEMPATASAAPAAARDRLDVHVAPNPVRESATLELRMPVAGLARVDLFDVQGRHVRPLLPATRLAAGSHRATWSAGDLREGLYFVRASGAGFVRVVRVSLLRP